MKIVKTSNYIEKTAGRKSTLTQKDLDIMFNMFEKGNSFVPITRYFNDVLKNPITLPSIIRNLYQIYSKKNMLDRFEKLKIENKFKSKSESKTKVKTQKDLDIMFKMFEKGNTFSDIARHYADDLKNPVDEVTIANRLYEIYSKKNMLDRFEKLKIENRSKKQSNTNLIDITKDQKTEIIDRFVNKGETVETIVKNYNSVNSNNPIGSRGTVIRWLIDWLGIDKYKEISKINLANVANRAKVNKNLQNISNKDYGSSHELVVQDLFTICNIPNTPGTNGGLVVPYKDSNGQDRVFNPDFKVHLDGGFYFEVFGFSRGEGNSATQNYQDKMVNKKAIIKGVRSLDTRGGKIKGLTRFAIALDSQVCVENKCNQSLLSNVSIEATLIKMIPLLEKFGISLCTTYIKKLQEMSPQQLGKARKAIERTPVQHQPFPQTQPLNNPNVFRQQNQKVRTAQSEPISLPQIVSELSQQYKSVEMWLPEEQVAVYFKTPENLQAAMGNNQNQSYNFNQYQQQVPQQQNYFNLNAPMARAAQVENHL